MDELIRQRIAAQPRGWAAQLAVGLGCAALATFVRFGLTVVEPRGIAYVTYFPMLLVAGFLGGARASVACLLAGMVLGSYFFAERTGFWTLPSRVTPAVIAYLISGGLIVWLCQLVSQAFRSEAESRRQEKQLILELQHRVKNTLAIVQAIARQTLHNHSDRSLFETVFTDRLIALGRAHNVLSDASWREVTLPSLVRRALEPFADPETGRFVLDGEPVSLAPDLIVDLALCLHELGANATKHGALSSAAGQVNIRWRSLAHDRIELVWSESGGPPVTPPTRQGFGSRLLAQGLSRKARPEVQTDYHPEGLVWRAEFDVGALAPP
ncbi:MAG TPA: HWE histidine kinase domain-containing protein [Phenylobacterium sp.]|nr:HWE histidine kinase domain-containing protein [Phenylobacterium sp.]